MPRDAEGESERQTRRKRIDPLLESSGWKIVAFAADCQAGRCAFVYDPE
jgi:type I site-specific restriction endonuclease